MKKFFFLFIIFISTYPLSAQLADRSFFKAGFHAALPLGDASEISEFSAGVDLYQHWGVSKTIDLGLATGFTNAFGKTLELNTGVGQVKTEFENVQFIPIAVLFRIYTSGNINLGADLGYAVGITEGNQGGFYYRPTLAIGLATTTELYLTYTGIRQDLMNWTTVSGGVVFRF